MQEPEEPYELIAPEDFLAHRPLPADARRMGFDRNTEEGALLALASALDPAKPVHRLAAWFMLLAIAGPIVLGLLIELL